MLQHSLSTTTSIYFLNCPIINLCNHLFHSKVHSIFDHALKHIIKRVKLTSYLIERNFTENVCLFFPKRFGQQKRTWALDYSLTYNKKINQTLSTVEDISLRILSYLTAFSCWKPTKYETVHWLMFLTLPFLDRYCKLFLFFVTRNKTIKW